MCVVALARKEGLTEEHIRKMYAQNKDGGGVAYRLNGRVHWQKGMSEQEMQELLPSLALPYVAHFRIASCGGVRPDLTHPFPISKDVSLALKGSTTGSVLFHNGHYGRWKDQLLALAVGSGIKVPTGAWSDSRLMAWVAAHCGTGVLPFFDEKLINFGVDDMDIFGLGWSEVDGLYVSNRVWEHSHTTTVYRGGNRPLVCRYKDCKQDSVGSTVFCEDHPYGQPKDVSNPTLNRDRVGPEVTHVPATFRGSHNTTRSQGADEETMEEVEKSLRSRRSQDPASTAGQTEGALTEAARAHAWARRLNPKTLHTATPPPLQEDGDYTEWGGFVM